MAISISELILKHIWSFLRFLYRKDKSPKVNIEKAINDSLILSKDMDIYLNYSLNLSYLNSKEKETSKLIETQPTKASFSTLKNSSLGKLFR